ncbi:DNA polymerase alpha/epsilon subunit B-domain-containing protein [Dimargaris cristalligena]|uniref:DNA polymerase alpha subunit B n=1 Tax=Dimargaris cristalligena TaxID=215637 RepID=A0A4V1J5J3_9FUNG|nr:DNA polymerase alpha/epsilon subunit B-domain-containing protein [Dimargaris cristalligena]|eukprot:RKP39259.1 DNA polymerase alpha/epsilon subunit B-domain-containing protein [Dimargaris cristalligena]
MSQPLHVTPDNITEAFGDLVDGLDKTIVEFQSLCNSLNISAEDLFYKWDAYAMQQESRIKAEDLPTYTANGRIRPEAEYLVRFRTHVMRSDAYSANGSAFPSMPSPQSKRFMERVNRGKCEDTFNNHLAAVYLTLDDPAMPFELDVPLSGQVGPFRYMHQKLRHRAAVLDQMIDWYAEEIQTAHAIPFDGLSDPARCSQAPVIVVGRICSESEAKLNDRSVVLEASRATGGGSRTRLALDQLPSLAFFPGQLVALEGVNATGETFAVTRQLTLPPLTWVKSVPAPDIQAYQAARMDRPLVVMAATGPFTLDDNLDFEPLADFFTAVRRDRPDVVILQGPFIDHNHPLVVDGDLDDTPAGLFQSHILPNFLRGRATEGGGGLLGSSQGAYPPPRIVLVPSPRDLLHPYLTFPQPAFDYAHAAHSHSAPGSLPSQGGGVAASATSFTSLGALPSHVVCVSNPARLRLNEINVVISNADVLFHLGAEEIARAPLRTDRLGRLAKHLLDQRSLYPVVPPAALDLNLQVQHYESTLRLTEAPDVLLLGSQLNPFAKEVDQVLCVNTSQLTKKQIGGTYVKMTLHPIPDATLEGGLLPMGVCGRTRVDIIRV